MASGASVQSSAVADNGIVDNGTGCIVKATLGLAIHIHLKGGRSKKMRRYRQEEGGGKGRKKGRQRERYGEEERE